MLKKRLIAAAVALAVLIPLAGCRHHRCCKSEVSSFASPCCPPGGATLPPTVLPPAP